MNSLQPKIYLDIVEMSKSWERSDLSPEKKHSGFARQIIDNFGVQINKVIDPNWNHRNVVHIFAEEGNKTILKALIAAGAELGARNYEGKSVADLIMANPELRDLLVNPDAIDAPPPIVSQPPAFVMAAHEEMGPPSPFLSKPSEPAAVSPPSDYAASSSAAPAPAYSSSSSAASSSSPAASSSAAPALSSEERALIDQIYYAEDSCAGWQSRLDLLARVPHPGKIIVGEMQEAETNIATWKKSIATLNDKYFAKYNRLPPPRFVETNPAVILPQLKADLQEQKNRLMQLGRIPHPGKIVKEEIQKSNSQILILTNKIEKLKQKYPELR